MFHFFAKQSKERPATPPKQSILNRTLLLAGALLLLWVALQVAPTPSSSTASSVFSDASGTVATSPQASTSTFSEVRSVLLAILLTALVGIGGFVLSRRRKQGAPAQRLNLMGSMALGQNHQVKLVGCGDDALLLGLTQGQITVLRTYPKSDFAPPPSEAEPVAFNALLEQASIAPSTT